MAFDSNRIISLGSDDTMRFWAWGGKVEAADKFHVLSKVRGAGGGVGRGWIGAR